MNPILPLKQRFFSSDQLGVVVTSSDFVSLGTNLEIDISKKSAETLLVDMISSVKATKKEQEFANFSSKMIQKKAEDLQNLIKSYKNTQIYFQKKIAQAEQFAEELSKGAYLG